MLTFFEYLRQRAFESILTGAQEAIEVLDNQKNFNQPKKLNAEPTNRPLDSRSHDEAKQEPRPTQEQSQPAEGDPLPEPRRRGRPQQKKGNG